MPDYRPDDPTHVRAPTAPLPGRPWQQTAPLRPPTGPAGPQPAHPVAPTFSTGDLPAPRKPAPPSGWRKTLYTISFGLINIGPSRQARDDQDLIAAAQAPLQRRYKIGVLGKGGVGKTTVAASVGSLLAMLRQSDRVVALDADTGFGRLGSRVDPRAADSYWDINADQHLETFADIRARVGANSAGLFVLPGEVNPARRRTLDPAVYRAAATQLDRHFTISMVDCGSTLDSAVTQEALRDVDALIVVSSPWVDGAAAAAQTLEWLSSRRMEQLLSRTVVVLNDSDGHADKKTQDALVEKFGMHGRPVITVPFDPALRVGGVIDVQTDLRPATRRAFLTIAATLTANFSAALRAAGPQRR